MIEAVKNIKLIQGFYRDSNDMLAYISLNKIPTNCQIEYPGKKPRTILLKEIESFTYVPTDTSRITTQDEKRFVVSVLERELAKMPTSEAMFLKNYLAFRSKRTK